MSTKVVLFRFLKCKRGQGAMASDNWLFFVISYSLRSRWTDHGAKICGNSTLNVHAIKFHIILALLFGQNWEKICKKFMKEPYVIKIFTFNMYDHLCFQHTLLQSTFLRNISKRLPNLLQLSQFLFLCTKLIRMKSTFNQNELKCYD